MYIRTKDGRIIEVKERRVVFPVFPAGEPRTIFNNSILEKDILKQANTIEELADYFFHLTYNVDTDNYEINYWGRAKEIDNYLKDYKEGLMFGIGIGEDKLFFANLTDKGIVFVAKMNRKGDFKLL